MRYFQLLESTQSQLLDLIHKAQNHFGADDLFYGNCGEFAWALAEYVQKILHEPATLCFLTNKFDDDGNLMDDPRGADIYHVIMQTHGLRYDGQGICTDSYLIKFAQRAYYKNADEIELWTDYKLDDESEYIIRDGTDSTIKADQFLEFFKSLA